jgi:hypothetical protein
MLLNKFSVSNNSKAWFITRGMTAGFSNHAPLLPENHRLWMVQDMLASYWDEVPLSVTMSQTTFNTLNSEKSYRMMTEVVAEYRIASDRSIKRVAFYPTERRNLIGPTKFLKRSWADSANCSSSGLPSELEPVPYSCSRGNVSRKAADYVGWKADQRLH